MASVARRASSPHPRDQRGPPRPVWPVPSLLALALLCACTGDRGPMGPPGPAGEGLAGTTYVARFEGPGELDTWLFGVSGSWEMGNGALVITSPAGERMTAGPSTVFRHDVDISVELAGVTLTSATLCGIRFHVSGQGAYQFGVGSEGVCRFKWEDSAGRTGMLLDQTLSPGLPRTIRVVRRGASAKLYVNDNAVGTVTDAGLQEGYVQLFVEGRGTVAFDNVWVGTALPLQ